MSHTIRGIAYIIFGDEKVKENAQPIQESEKRHMSREDFYHHPYMLLTREQATELDLTGLPTLVEHTGGSVGHVTRHWCSGDELRIEASLHDATTIDRVRRGELPSLSVRYAVVTNRELSEMSPPKKGYMCRNTADSHIVFIEISLVSEPFFRGCDQVAASKEGPGVSHYRNLRMVLVASKSEHSEKNASMSETHSESHDDPMLDEKNPEQSASSPPASASSSQQQQHQQQQHSEKESRETSNSGSSSSAEKKTTDPYYEKFLNMSDEEKWKFTQSIQSDFSQVLQEQASFRMKEFEERVPSLRERGFQDNDIEDYRKMYVTKESLDPVQKRLFDSIMKLTEPTAKSAEKNAQPPNPQTNPQTSPQTMNQHTDRQTRNGDDGGDSSRRRGATHEQSPNFSSNPHKKTKTEQSFDPSATTRQYSTLLQERAYQRAYDTQFKNSPPPSLGTTGQGTAKGYLGGGGGGVQSNDGLSPEMSNTLVPQVGASLGNMNGRFQLLASRLERKVSEKVGDTTSTQNTVLGKFVRSYCHVLSSCPEVTNSHMAGFADSIQKPKANYF